MAGVECEGAHSPAQRLAEFAVDFERDAGAVPGLKRQPDLRQECDGIAGMKNAFEQYFVAVLYLDRAVLDCMDDDAGRHTGGRAKDAGLTRDGRRRRIGRRRGNRLR